MQSRRSSLAEAFLNTFSGYVISVFVQLLVFPRYGINLSLGDNLTIVAIFTAVSIVRNYLWRRLFNRYPIWRA